MRRFVKCGTEPAQPYLPADTLLLEWFIADGRPYSSWSHADMIKVRRLNVEIEAIRQTLRCCGSISAVFARPGRSRPALTLNATAPAKAVRCAARAGRRSRGALSAAGSSCPTARSTICHFHALHDGRTYLVEDHEISYLPGSSLLRYCCRPRRRPMARWRSATRAMAACPTPSRKPGGWPRPFGGEAYVDDAATVARLREAAGGVASCTWRRTATSAPTTHSSPAWRWPMAG